MRKFLRFSGMALLLASGLRLLEAAALNWSPWPAMPLFLLGVTALFIASVEAAS